MSLEVDIEHRIGAFSLDVRFASEGRLTALFGRSGAGKTMTVNIIAGLIRPDRGRVAIEGRVLVDTARGIRLPVHRRRVGYVFQESRLFPHLTVRQNLLYGRWFTPAAERRETLSRVVELLGIGHLLDRRPALLSGGETQRVAIGRALLASPRLLLMDEPVAALDDTRKSEILPYIERLRDETQVPIIYVSHSVPEVARLANTLVLLSDGKVAAVGPAREVLARQDLIPLSSSYEGGAIIETRVLGHDDAYGLTRLGAAAGELRVPRLDLPEGAPVRVRIRARDVIIADRPPVGLSALNLLPGRVLEIGSGDGPSVELSLDLAGDRVLARVTRQSIDALALAPGRPVYAVIKSVAFDRDSLAARALPSGVDYDGADL